jgi:hypothetical protein
VVIEPDHPAREPSADADMVPGHPDLGGLVDQLAALLDAREVAGAELVVLEVDLLALGRRGRGGPEQVALGDPVDAAEQLVGIALEGLVSARR